MLSLVTVATAGMAWLALMFAAALYGERRPNALAGWWPQVYALSLAVHCTSWTFYGTVTQAARHGWWIPPTLLGAILFYLLAARFMGRLVTLARESNATSLADLIAARLGRDAWLAATVTAVAALGLIPYIALQLKAVAMSFAMITTGHGDAGQASPAGDSALYVAMVMAAFAILFGARRADASAHNRGLVLAMAVESVFKLLAMMVLAVFVLWWLPRQPGVAGVLASTPVASSAGGGFVPLMLLGALAMFILPHQFHMAVVECRDKRDMRIARWLFPLYLALMALPLLPLARAGVALLPGVHSDMYTLALPAASGQHGVALLAFLGGLSAATGMVVVSVLTLSLMIGNHWFAPGLLRGAWSRRDGTDHRRELLWLRRLVICATMLLAWGYSRIIAASEVLADIGAVSFSALATLLPVLGFALWRPQTSPRAAVPAVLLGFATWAWVLVAPSVWPQAGAVVDGPFGQAWLSPSGFFGLTGWTALGRAVGASLFVGTLTTFVVMLWRSATPAGAGRSLDAEVLREAGRRFLAPAQVEALLAGAPRHGPVPVAMEARMERALSAVLGSASARLLLDAARREQGDLATVAAIVSEASADLRFNQQVLEAALNNMSQGISVIDSEQRLVAWNRRYADLFGFPPGWLQVGTPIADITAWALERMPDRGAGSKATERRLAHMRAGTAHLSERVFPDGSIVEIRGNPLPGGGFVATFTDVTAFRRAEAELKRSNELLEQRVTERTALLEHAKRQAERANDAKSRFLAAVGHDLLQPLHAAHLFTDTLAQQLREPGKQQVVGQIRGALDSTTDLLTGLFDMSRLEAGGLVPQPRTLPLAEVLAPLASQFGAMAAAKGLRFHYVGSNAWVHTDPQLLRRVLQNFLANAVRYTGQGGVLLGVRRAGGQLRLEVHDTGPGIAEDNQQAIFEEFRRGEGAPGQGLGLGLAIAERIARLLGLPLGLRSRPGRGTVFHVTVATVARPQAPAAPAGRAGALAGVPVLVVDNDPQALAALAGLLRGWGCVVHEANGEAAARAQLAAHEAALWLFDYNLDDGDTGTALRQRLAADGLARPTLILSADDSLATRREVLEQGLTLLQKPVRPLALKSVLDRLLAAAASA